MRFTYLLLTVFSLALLSACSEEEQAARSMEQIYAEEGVPVRVRTLAQQPFVTSLTYNAVLTGIEESSALASVGDKVDKIYVKVGDYVKKDDILLMFPTDNPAAQYFQAKVAFENSEKAYQRIENLYKTGGISKQQLDNAMTNYEVSKANWDAAQQTVMVKAPISGYVTSVNVRESDNVKKDKELFTISQMDRMKAKIWIAEKEANDVHKGLKAHAEWNGIRIDGRVVEVDMALNQMKQAFGATVEFNNPEKILKFGITVAVSVQTYENPQTIVVERKNLMQDAQGFYAYVVREGKPEIVRVRIGKASQLDVEITSGLKAGDQLIIEGQMLLAPDSKLKIIE